MGKHKVKLHPDCLDCQQQGSRCYTCRANVTRLASDRATRNWTRKHRREWLARQLDRLNVPKAPPEPPQLDRKGPSNA